MTASDAPHADLLARIAAALERMAPPAAAPIDFDAAEAFVWHAEPAGFEPVATVNRVPLGLLKGIDRAADQLLANTERFARDLPANNALLWGARGMGKSSLVKAAHAEVSSQDARPEAGRDPSRGHLLAAGLPRLPQGVATPLHRVLRRPVVRPRRHQLQIAEGRARGRHRGPARAMCCSTPPPTAAT